MSENAYNFSRLYECPKKVLALGVATNWSCFSFRCVKRIKQNSIKSLHTFVNLIRFLHVTAWCLNEHN